MSFVLIRLVPFVSFAVCVVQTIVIAVIQKHYNLPVKTRKTVFRALLCATIFCAFLYNYRLIIYGLIFFVLILLGLLSIAIILIMKKRGNKASGSEQ